MLFTVTSSLVSLLGSLKKPSNVADVADQRYRVVLELTRNGCRMLDWWCRAWVWQHSDEVLHVGCCRPWQRVGAGSGLTDSEFGSNQLGLSPGQRQRDSEFSFGRNCALKSDIGSTPPFLQDWVKLLGALILLIVVAPSLFSGTIRDGWIGVVICLAIVAYLLQEHIRASVSFRNSFAKASGISNTIGIIILSPTEAALNLALRQPTILPLPYPITYGNRVS
ncbi:COR413PM2 protein [Hibiscus syriacus]|uniref:COR413PM2 protein n=1 Tax=Hibiscus syriacus TaxID=106335 RepID=A0A6A2X590_HIBSY|nr:COR413PM2 protein [Hibiscus syriacus]